MKNINLSRGQALVEAIVAFAIAAVVLMALLQLSSKATNNSGEATRQSQATSYANQAMQWVKSQRPDGWEDFAPNCGIPVSTCDRTYCLNELSWTADCVAVPLISGTEFYRQLNLKGAVVGSKQQITATVTVSWEEAGRTATAKQTTIFAQR